MIDAIARHHAYWWDNDRLASLPWLMEYNSPPFIASIIQELRGCLAEVPASGRFGTVPCDAEFRRPVPSSIPWFLEQITRRPCTFLHGDLRLDQLFFAVNADDPPLTALDWQLAGRGRGAYDVGYFLGQSMTTEDQAQLRGCMLERYAERLAEHGIDYPRAQLKHDYRLATAWCFIYPVMAEGRIEIVNDRNQKLIRTIVNRSVAAIEDHDGLSLRPD